MYAVVVIDNKLDSTGIHNAWCLVFLLNRRGTSIATMLPWRDSTSSSRRCHRRNVNMPRRWWSTRTRVVVGLFSSLLMYATVTALQRWTVVDNKTTCISVPWLIESRSILKSLVRTDQTGTISATKAIHLPARFVLICHVMLCVWCVCVCVCKHLPTGTFVWIQYTPTNRGLTPVG